MTGVTLTAGRFSDDFLCMLSTRVAHVPAYKALPLLNSAHVPFAFTSQDLIPYWAFVLNFIAT